VSIGIPTYNRAATLGRAVESALAQTYTNIEVVICDDGSSDSTNDLCRALAARDPRVRYLRSPSNQGLAANHNKLFGQLRGRYAMLLSDDDWLAPNYVERCLNELALDPRLALVGGIARYVGASGDIREGVAFDLEDGRPQRRIKAYLKLVDENGLLYGLMPRAVLKRAAPMRNVLANDWLLVMGVLGQGTVRTLTDTAILREPGGASASFAKLTAAFGLPRWQARVPHLAIAWTVFAEIAWRGQVYRSLAPAARLRLAFSAAWAAIRWRSLAWHLIVPTFAALAERRGGRPVRRLCRWLTRRAGAG
jgi:glycosyltransferase involved in cell wall biosynthesis